MASVPGKVMKGTGDMSRFVVDASAWIEYLDGSARGTHVENLIMDETNEIFTASLSVTEVVSKIKRRNRDGRSAGQSVEAASVVAPMDFTLAVSAGLIHAEARRRIPDFPYGDAAVVALARAMRARIVTCDSHFEKEKDVVFLR